ncbi:MAG: polysaccharide deacetylase family protein [Gammaproteobacteria bacterium]
MLGTAVLSLAAVLGSIGIYAIFWPRSQLFGRVLYGDPSKPPRVALTFDDGPSLDVTPRILDILAEQRVRAAFFVIGRNVERHPALVRRMDAEGHLVASHGYDHSPLGLFRRRAYWERQVASTDAAVIAAIGKRPWLFRPPWGCKQYFMTAALAAQGKTIVTWRVRGLDGAPTTAARILRRILSRVRGGDVLTLHDGHQLNEQVGRDATVEALRPLILALRARGIEPARLDELLHIEPYCASAASAASSSLTRIQPLGSKNNDGNRENGRVRRRQPRSAGNLR